MGETLNSHEYNLSQNIFSFESNFSEVSSKLQQEQQDYKTTYNPVPYKEKNDDPYYFFLSLKAYEEIINHVPQVQQKILESLNGNSHEPIINKWKQGIESILYKALIAESVKYGQWIAEDIAEKTKDEKSVNVLELCSGAGITTCMTYLERLNADPHKKTRIFSIDNSIESLACASLLASSFGIASKICLPEDRNMISEEFDGIIFIVDDANRFINKQLRPNEFSYVVSDNGISYFPEETHKKILQGLNEKLDSSLIYISSLKKGKSVNLSLPFKITGILKGKSFPIKQDGSQYIERNNVITKTYTKETQSFFGLANKMLTRGNGIKDLKKLLGILSSATKSSQILNQEILSPVSKTKKIATQSGFRINETFPKDDKAPCEVVVLSSK